MQKIEDISEFNIPELHVDRSRQEEGFRALCHRLFHTHDVYAYQVTGSYDRYIDACGNTADVDPVPFTDLDAISVIFGTIFDTMPPDLHAGFIDFDKAEIWIG